MARTRVDSKGDPIARNRKGTSATVRTSDGDGNVDVHQAELIPTDAADLQKVMSWFADHGAGYLKLRRDELGADYHMAWQWTRGAHAGTYVYVRVEYWRYAFGLELLSKKMWEVEEGQRRPTPDKYH